MVVSRHDFEVTRNVIIVEVLAFSFNDLVLSVTLYIIAPTKYKGVTGNCKIHFFLP